MGVVSGAISFERQRGREVAFDRRTVEAMQIECDFREGEEDRCEI
jgi:hypothetical protein